MRWSLTFAAVALLTLTASESSAQHASTRLSVRTSVVRSCTVQTGGNAATPAQVNCTRGAGPVAITTTTTTTSTSASAAAGDYVVNAGAPQPVTEVVVAASPVASVEATPAPADAAASTEWPTEAGAITPPAAARPVYQIVTINF